MKKAIYSIAAVAILASAGFMIYQALNTSLVYFILPNEYAKDPNTYQDKRLRLGGLVESGSVEKKIQVLWLKVDFKKVFL